MNLCPRLEQGRRQRPERHCWALLSLQDIDSQVPARSLDSTLTFEGAKKCRDYDRCSVVALGNAILGGQLGAIVWHGITRHSM
jgi:hypothetical protein